MRSCANYEMTMTGRYDRQLLGIFQLGDLTSIVEEAKADVVILEEPEHLTWYHHGPRWSERFKHVVCSIALFVNTWTPV